MSNVQYISQEGLDKLKEEYAYRKDTLRKEISEAISVAKEQGDLSENFEYQHAKDRQAENEVKIAALEIQIRDAVIVESKTGEATISLGTRFKVEVEGGAEQSFEMVGSSEADPVAGKISNESPLGNAFLSKAIGDLVEVETPAGKKKYKIISIE